MTTKILPLTLVSLLFACGDKDIDDTGEAPNSAPTAPEVSIEPAGPNTLDDLTATITTEATDADGDTITYTYSWTVNGADAGVGEATVPASETAKGQVWRVMVVASDGVDDSQAAMAEATVVNTPPRAETVSLTPEDAATNDTLTASTVGGDADSDTVTFSYVWLVDGVDVGVSGDTLSGEAWFDKGQEVIARVIPNDGTVDGQPLESAGVVISNTAPGDPEVTILPEHAGSLDDLVCAVATEAEDQDADAVTYTFTWDVDGNGYGGEVAETYLPGDTVLAANLSTDETWTCTASASDGEDTSGEVSASVTLIYPALVVDGVEVLLTEGTYQHGRVEVINGGILIIEGAVVIEGATSFLVDSASWVDGSNAGPAGGDTTPTDGTGTGPGTSSTNSGGGGGGYGGDGGLGGHDSRDTPGTGGLAYGDETSQSINQGSGGGGTRAGVGGNGGASLMVTATDIAIDGAIHLDGGDGVSGTQSGGGGSGGGLLLVGDTISIVGEVSANGGAGGTGQFTYQDGGGGGGGGRIKVFYGTSYTVTGAVTADGGLGGDFGEIAYGEDGATGTIYDVQQAFTQ